jgi:hypothetical protein
MKKSIIAALFFVHSLFTTEKRIKTWLTLILVSTFLTTHMTTVYADTMAKRPATTRKQGNTTYSLTFNPKRYTVKTFTLKGQTITYRAFEDIIYVRHPVDTKYQRMNFYVPVEYYNGKSAGSYTAQTAPIFFPNEVGGYMPGEPGIPGLDRRSGEPNAAIVALSKGYVVAAPGARGRITRDKKGRYNGKAPAAIVDLKAAVRYLRHNDKIMPGDAERIISNGTSAGGALSALLGATGNNAEYEPYLKEIGAAEARDNIFAVSAYCPITNLDNADKAYEWLFNGVNDYKKIQFSMLDYKVQRTETPGILKAQEISTSGKLKALFPAYVNGLGLKRADGTALTLDANSNGTFKEYVKSFVIASAQKALDGGADLSSLTWITIRNRNVTDLDFDRYIAYVGRMKTPPAFDALDASSGENNLFGAATINNQHFTRFSKDHDTTGASLADAAIVTLMNPMKYIGKEGTTTARYWRIRHGSVDKDTSLAIPIILATALQNSGLNVDFALPWNRPHSGDYDLNELFAWISQISR